MSKTFPNKNLTELMHTIFAQALELRVRKGAEYAGDQADDALANFRRNGLDAGVSMETCWRIYAGKHWDAISQYVRDVNVGNFSRDRMEPIEGRVDDLIVYLILLKAMIIERKGEREEKLKEANPLVQVDLNDPSPWNFKTGLPQN